MLSTLIFIKFITKYYSKVDNKIPMDCAKVVAFLSTREDIFLYFKLLWHLKPLNKPRISQIRMISMWRQGYNILVTLFILQILTEHTELNTSIRANFSTMCWSLHCVYYDFLYCSQFSVKSDFIDNGVSYIYLWYYG